VINILHFNNRSTVTKVIYVIIAVLSIAAIGYGLPQPVDNPVGDSVTIVVKSGMTTQTISDMLYERGIIKSGFVFRVVARIKGLSNTLKAGEYTFNKDMSIIEMVGVLGRGETENKDLTVPEGYTINQIAELIEQKKMGSAQKFRDAAASFAPFDYMISSSPVVYKAEGYVFPDTYKIATDATEAQILEMMVNQFDSKFTPEMRQKANNLGLSIREVVILASLVEKEARVADERPVIAGVFRNRIKAGMALQSCATIQYILGHPKSELTIQDTEIPSDYNTYLHPGLPPGPISNPGLASINAVLNPVKTDYLYFVADKKGEHHRFSRTYTEHLAAIEQENK